ncbi:COX7a domain containing protein [Pyrenophora tritici-repentis]|uniref:COX7a domain containing protein n=1 Tax=Pyrenophora tritici-repentis TaxID=45151 RepID=A0A316ZZS1_9PLEO|nr:COX7a domain containing protein [Pyrenophora tritici-repentis]KAI1518228.1 COX7a domain containing protein [Pyrenophora tritici-repentis]KAI1688952.1 COX7a domain containing protein [Pyrenophora tritici-repentis]
MAGWVMRENRVPYWQREHQKHDGLRTWEKVRYQYIREGKRGAHYMWMKREHQRLVDMDSARGKWMIPGYKVLLFGSLSASMYMMGRLVLGHKTWFGKN